MFKRKKKKVARNDIMKELAATRSEEKRLVAAARDSSYSGIADSYSSYSMTGKEAYEAQALSEVMARAGISVQEAIERIKVNLSKPQKREEKITARERQLLF